MNVQQAPPSELTRPPTTLHFRVREHLLDRILSGELRPGDQIPTEADLITHFGVSRTTVRRALQDIENAGLIRRQAGRGTFVTIPRLNQELRRVTGFVEDMDKHGLRASAQLITAELVEASQRVADALKVPLGSEVAHIDRVRLGNGQPISVDVSYLVRDVGDVVMQHDLATNPIYSIIEDVIGEPLSYADYAIEATVADTLLARLLDVAAGSPILDIERTTYGSADRALMYENLYYRADRIRYRLRLPR